MLSLINLRNGNGKPSKQKVYPPSSDSYLNGIGDYVFIKPIGQGKFSKVILANHYLTNEKVAIKVIDKRVHDYRIMSRLVREITLMEMLYHPNIVRLYQTYETMDTLYLVMEYIDGYNLDEFLHQKHGVLSEHEARDIFRQMVSAMDYCHSKGVVHRDLKAPNILLTHDMKVKIADFGLGNKFGRRRLKTICGSMLYYSPEIINGHGYIGPEVDCWCLGVSLYRMTVGEEPFSKSTTVGDLRRDVTAGNFTIPNSLSKELQQTISKCMSIDKTKRTRVHLALKDDAWLNKNGQLSDLFSIESNIPIDKEEKKRVKRTLICHPTGHSTYYTSTLVPASPHPEDIYTHREAIRHVLLQRIHELSRSIQLESCSSKSPIKHFMRKLKQPSVPPPPLLRKATSNMSLSQLYQRVTKDQVHYYSFRLSPEHVVRYLPGISDLAQQDECMLMKVVIHACDMMGISYYMDRHDRMTCIMVLNHVEQHQPRMYPLKKDSKMTPSPNPSLTEMTTSMSHASSSSDLNKSSYASSSRFSKIKRVTSHVLSSMFPHQPNTSTVVIKDTITSIPTSQLDIRQKESVAMFIVESFSLSNNNPHQRTAVVKLTKLEGSSKVFRIASGWITAVIGGQKHAHLSDIADTQRRKSVITFMPTYHVPKSKSPLSME
ncbi:hypothetical protein RMATCC62417_02450 [Rhizopus microsporus]|nr:hypothetical protein RMATCC62417_02450 [Rhizopus microsporus]